MAGRGVGPDPGGSWESLKAREPGMTQSELSSRKLNQAECAGSWEGAEPEARRQERGLAGGGGGAAATGGQAEPPDALLPQDARAGRCNQNPSPTLMLHLPPPKDPCSPRSAPSLCAPLPLTPSVYAAPAGHPGKAQLGAQGAPGALGAPWAAAGDAGSSTQRSPDAPSWLSSPTRPKPRARSP